MSERPGLAQSHKVLKHVKGRNILYQLSIVTAVMELITEKKLVLCVLKSLIVTVAGQDRNFVNNVLHGAAWLWCACMFVQVYCIRCSPVPCELLTL